MTAGTDGHPVSLKVTTLHYSSTQCRKGSPNVRDAALQLYAHPFCHKPYKMIISMSS